MGVLKEIWTGELVKQFREVPTFLDPIKDYSAKVEGNKTIHLASVGADPSVLINNTTYPIAVAGRTDGDIAITLDKFDTENTEVSDDELEGLSYDKIRSVNEQHVEVLVEATGDKAIHSLAPASDSAATPVITTAAATLTVADIRKLKRKFDDQKFPKMGRVLVLCPQHVEELLAASENFEKQYNIDNKEGKIGRLMGFDIYEYVGMPVYNAGSKQAFGAASDPADKVSSIAYCASRMFKANNKAKMYKSKAEDDPQYRRTVIGYMMRHIALPKKNEAIGAIIAQ